MVNRGDDGGVGVMGLVCNRNSVTCLGKLRFFGSCNLWNFDLFVVALQFFDSFLFL